ncbi:hypothetical protein KEM52_006382 [Ascosphaera acerosa]|nr:hypothetical protein KEM52_006382 [Ascosphaera acerosa]
MTDDGGGDGESEAASGSGSGSRSRGRTSRRGTLVVTAPDGCNCTGKPSDSPMAPTPTPTPTATATAAATTDLLDGPLARYLDLVAQYQEERAALSTCLSAGFISLAQANHSAPAGHRYGETYYDERMKALRTARCQPRATCGVDLDPVMEVGDDVEYTPHGVTGGVAQESQKQRRARQNAAGIAHLTPDTALQKMTDDMYKWEPRPPATIRVVTAAWAVDSGHASDGGGDADVSSSSDVRSDAKDGSDGSGGRSSTGVTGGADDRDTSSPPATAPPIASPDPLRWFGILVPHSLRQAQAAFARGVDGPVARLASILVEMDRLEGLVRQAREMRDRPGPSPSKLPET